MSNTQNTSQKGKEPLFGNAGKQTNRLEGFATELVAKNTFIKASFAGFAGSGKTKTATDLIIGCYKDMKIEKPLLLIDNEKGSRFLIPIFKKAGIKTYVKDTVALPDVLEAMEMLNNGDIGFLFIDTLSKIWYKYVSDYKVKNRITFMSLQDWGKILPAWQETFSDKFVECNGNFIFTGRGGFQYEKEEDTTNEAGQVTKKGQFVKSGVKMKLAGETPFEPDVNIWMEQEQEVTSKGLIVYRTAQVIKDRSGVIDGKLFKNPTYKDFQPVIKFLMANPTGEVAGQSSNENLAPAEDYASQNRRTQREIENEKIKAVFDKMEIGSSKEDKALKVKILEKFFGTSSGKELEIMKPERLTQARELLDKLYEQWVKVQPEERLTLVDSFNLAA